MKAIEVENVSKKFKEFGKEFYALKDVSFSVKDNEIFCLLGPNGSGKTTMLNIIMNILVPNSGSVKILGNEVNRDKSVLEKVNFVSGDARFHWSIKVENILNFFGMIYNLEEEKRKSRIEKLVRAFGIEYLMKRRYFTLSTGEKMRVVLAKSLINEPKIILMDEPTLGLDPDIAITVRNEIKKANKKFKTTILLTSHYMYEVEELADRIAFLNKGSIIDTGTVEKVKSKKFSTYEVLIRLSEIKDKRFLLKHGFHINGNIISKRISAGDDINKILSILQAGKFSITNIETRKPTLEDYFVKISSEARKNENA